MNRQSLVYGLLCLLFMAVFPLSPALAQGDGARELGRMQTTGAWSGIRAQVQGQKFAVLRQEEEWQRLWFEDIGRAAPHPLPWGAMGVAVFLGQRSTGGYTVAIEEIQEEPERITIHYRETRPSARGLVTTAFTSPYAVKLVPVSEKDVLFRAR